jgi:hypothetical protein
MSPDVRVLVWFFAAASVAGGLVWACVRAQRAEAARRRAKFDPMEVES